MRELINHTVLPNPWEPCPGDVYQRMNADGYERLVVTAVGLDDVNREAVKMALPDGSLKLVDPYGFRCRIVCLGMVPAGRMKTESERTT